MSMPTTDYDVVVLGAGVVGLCSAVLCAEAGWRVALVETQQGYGPEGRVSAINHASRAVFERLGAWARMEAMGVSPYDRMQVWESSGRGRLQFDHAAVGSALLGHIIEHSVMRAALQRVSADADRLQWYCPARPMALNLHRDRVEIVLSDQRFSTALVVGADGANSWTRKQVEIPVQIRSYHQTACVATVRTEKPHERTAYQVFLSRGPLAFLPLRNPYHCSIVWSTHPEHAQQLSSFSPEECNAQLSDYFRPLGAVSLESPVLSFPLYQRHAQRYTRDRVVLIGDAAHTLHPLAGQGVNLGIRDAAYLAQRLGVATTQKDAGAWHRLRAYERGRRAENGIMLFAMDSLNFVLSSDASCASAMARVGLNAVDRLPMVKRALMRCAMGTVTQ